MVRRSCRVQKNRTVPLRPLFPDSEIPYRYPSKPAVRLNEIWSSIVSRIFLPVALRSGQHSIYLVKRSYNTNKYACPVLLGGNGPIISAATTIQRAFIARLSSHQAHRDVLLHLAPSLFSDKYHIGARSWPHPWTSAANNTVLQYANKFSRPLDDQHVMDHGSRE